MREFESSGGCACLIAKDVSWEELPEDGGAEEAEEVAAAGEAEARDEVGLRHRGASQDAPALEHGDGAARAGEVGGGDEAVVAAADHHGVPALAPGQLRQRGGR